jgi:electron transfer flavoprotein alpha subunit
MSKDIYVFIEQRDGVVAKVSQELVGAASGLAADLERKVFAVLIGDDVRDGARSLIEYGADGVVSVRDPILKEYVTEPYAKALTAVIRERDPEIVLFGATSIGRDLAPRVASRLRAGLTSDCVKFGVDPETKRLLMTKPAFGGDVMATIICKGRGPQMATVRPGVMKRLERDASRVGEVTEMKVAFTPSDMNVVIREVVRETREGTDVAEAGILVAGGRGAGSPELLDKLRELADVLGGELATTRANVDAGRVERDRQVGQTGRTVRPELYLACGISGAIQHVAGMEGSECVIAINKNDTAAIFDVADLGVVGDVKTIVPKLIEAVKKHKAANA